MKRWAENCGLTFDVAVNVLFAGTPFQTVSYRAAVAQRDGKPWGCLMCRFLSWAVQRDHCADQFTDTEAPAIVYVRAGVAFGVAFGIVGVALWELWQAL